MPSIKVAHTIQPKDVAAYVAAHQKNYQQMQLDFEGIPYQISMMKMDSDNNQIYVYLDKKNAVAGKSDEHDGYAIIGFN